jgi:hypothetical protein
LLRAGLFADTAETANPIAIRIAKSTRQALAVRHAVPKIKIALAWPIAN